MSTMIFRKRIDEKAYTWSRVSKESKDFYFEEFKRHYIWDPDNEAQVRKAWDLEASTCYTALVRDIRLSMVKPTFITGGTWRSFKYYWAMLKYLEKQPINKTNRLKLGSKQNGRTTTTATFQHEFKCRLWHLKRSSIIVLGTVYKSDRKQMLHSKQLPNDCYKVSIEESLVDAACISDVGNNAFKKVKDTGGSFVAWPKNLVVFDEKVTPPTSIPKVGENKTAPKLQNKRKFVSRDTVQKQARSNLKSQKSLNL